LGQRVHTGGWNTDTSGFLLDVYIVRLESSLISCDTVQGIIDHCGVLLDVEREVKGFVTKENRLVPAYHKTNVLGLQQYLREKYQHGQIMVAV